MNDYVKACRGNKYSAAKMKNEAEHIVSGYTMKAQFKNPHARFEKPVFVKFKWIEPNRARDKDNVAFAKKFIFDAFVKNGILKGDGWQYVDGFSDSFDVDKTNPRIEIEITEVQK